MALQTPSSVTTTAAAPVPITPTSSDTIPGSTFGPNGVYIRVITTGTATNVSVLDPGFTASSNPGTVTAQVMPATGSREWLIPRAAINSSGVATVTFSSLTGVTYEIKTI